MDPKIFVIILIALMSSTIILILALAYRTVTKPLEINKLRKNLERDLQKDLLKTLTTPTKESFATSEEPSPTPKIEKRYLEFCTNVRICPNCNTTCGSKRVCKKCGYETEPRIRLDYTIEGIRHRKLTTLWRRDDAEKYYEDLETQLSISSPDIAPSPSSPHIEASLLQEKVSKTKLDKYLHAEKLFLLKNEGKTLTEIINMEAVSKGEASKMINAFSLSSDGLKNCWKNGIISFSNVLEIIKISTETNRDQLKVLNEFLESKDHPAKRYSTRLMLSMRRQGKTYKEIVDYLTSNRIKPAKGQKWEISTIRKIVSRYNNQIS